MLTVKQMNEGKNSTRMRKGGGRSNCVEACQNWEIERERTKGGEGK